MTIPVVPRIDKPPTIPSRGFQVCPGDTLAIGNRENNRDIRGCTRALSRRRGSSFQSTARGAGLIAASPGGMGNPGLVTVPTPSPAWKVMPAPRRTLTDPRHDQCAMRDVGIVPGILHDTGGGGAVIESFLRQRKGWRFAFRQANRHRVGKYPGQQRLIGRARRGGGARPRGPAAAQDALVVFEP